MNSLPKKRILLIIIFFLSVSVSLAQDVTVEISADKLQATLEDEIILQVVVKGSVKASDPVLPSLREFKIISMGTASSYHNINGNIQTEKSFTYVLIPQKEGTYTIEPVSVFAGGYEYKSDPLSIVITSSPGPNQTLGQYETTKNPKEKYWIEVSVSNKEPYVNQQILYTFRLYTSVDMGRASLTLPEFKNFWVEELVPENQFKTSIEGITYLVNEKVLALFPLGSGPLTIDETLLLVEVPDENIQDIYRDNIFNFRSTHKKTVELKKKPIEIKVLPLPQPVPNNFTQLVGNFNMAVKLNNSEVNFGDSATLNIKIEGSGNIKDAKLPSPFDIFSGFKIYEDKPSFIPQKKQNGIVGSKTFKLALVPTQEGNMEIPPFSLTYFNPQTKTYEELISSLLALNVLPGTKENLNSVVSGNNTSDQKEKLPVTQDIATIHTHFTLNGEANINQKALALLGFTLPPTIFFGISFLVWIKRRRQEDVNYRLKKLALKNYLHHTKKIDPRVQGVAKKLMESFQSYIRDKLQIEAYALTPEEMINFLKEKQVPKELYEPLEKLLAELETSYYGGVSHNKTHEWIKQAFPLIKKIDSYL